MSRIVNTLSLVDSDFLLHLLDHRFRTRYTHTRTKTKTTELEMQDITEERVAIGNAKLKLFKVLSCNNNALCDSSKFVFVFNILPWRHVAFGYSPLSVPVT